MRRNSFLVATLSALSILLLSGRCASDDKADDKAAGETAAPMSQSSHDPASPSSESGKLDSGIESDPLGDAMGSGDLPPLDESGELPRQGGDNAPEDLTPPMDGGQ